MEFINIPTALFSSPEYIGAEPVQRATWISLLAWCCEQENGGIIEGCRSWGMRRWMQTCGVTDQEINEENELYHFDGDHLVVFGYPHEIQETLKVKRKTARENGKLGGRPKKTNVETNIGTNAGTEEKPTSVFPETNVGTEIGTNVAPYVETYPKTVREGKEGSNTTTPTTTGREVCQFPQDVSEIDRFMAAQVLHPLGDELTRCAERFFNEQAAVGWKNKHGIPLADWRPLARQYAATWARNNAAEAGLKPANAAGTTPKSTPKPSRRDELWTD